MIILSEEGRDEAFRAVPSYDRIYTTECLPGKGKRVPHSFAFFGKGWDPMLSAAPGLTLRLCGASRKPYPE